MASPTDDSTQGDPPTQPESASPQVEAAADTTTPDAPPAPRKRATRKRAAAKTAEPGTDDAAGTDEPAASESAPAPRKRATRKRAAAKPAGDSADPVDTPPEATQDSDTAPMPRPGEAADSPEAVIDPSGFAVTDRRPAPEGPSGDTDAEAGVSADADENDEASSEVAADSEVAGAVLDPAEDPVVLAAQAAEPAQEETPAPAPTFGLIFQAPEVAPPPARRSRSPQPTDEDESPEPAQPRRGRGGRGGDAAERTSADESTDATTTDTPEDGEQAGGAGEGEQSGGEDREDGTRRRRRRGGKGRRRSDDSDNGDSADNGDDSDGSDAGDTGPSSDDPDTDSDDSGSGRRRTRRRRRSGSAGDSDDPPGTVTKVREPRQRRDEATGIKGSTRLEAKRQRRREGREAGRRRTIITEAEFLARRESVERVMIVREHGERTQIGVLEDSVLVEHYISGTGTGPGSHGASMAGNVYLGRVQNVLPSMEAAFVDIGKGRNAVLYAGEVNWDAAGLEATRSRRIENALSSGQSVLVQVSKDPIGHKGARLTSQVSLPGRYLVYVPEGSMTGISRKLPDTERARLKKILKQIVPDDAGVIVRTAAEGASEEELTADVERLHRVWENITKKAKTAGAPSLLHGEADLTTRVVRDVFNEDFSKLIVAGDSAWSRIHDYVESVAPDLSSRLEKWTGEQDVFAAHRVDEQLAKAMDRKVWLPSGGSLVIDRTEAMTVVDVNTGKFTGSGGNLEETVTKNNIEAAEEIVRQLRLRDIGGIIVVDFIDMVLEANRDLVVRRLLECLGRDRTKHQVAEVTSLGLVQMTRKRVGAGLIEVYSDPCEHCGGRGIIVSSEPIDRTESSSSSSSSSDSGRSPSRRGRGKGGDTPAPKPEPERPEPSGPTPAQIAAAAYAAAVQAGSSDAVGQVAADLAELAEKAEDADSSSSLQESSDARDEQAGRSAATDASARPAPSTEPAAGGADDADSTETHLAGSPAETPAPRRRRGARRAATAPATAPAGAEAAVFTVEEPSTPAPPATSTDTAVAESDPSPDAAAEQPGESPEEQATEQPTTPEPAPADPSQSPPRRAARRAAGAPAGPPPRTQV